MWPFTRKRKVTEMEQMKAARMTPERLRYLRQAADEGRKAVDRGMAQTSNDLLLGLALGGMLNGPEGAAVGAAVGANAQDDAPTFGGGESGGAGASGSWDAPTSTTDSSSCDTGSSDSSSSCDTGSDSGSGGGDF